jgi:hypothetical protein
MIIPWSTPRFLEQISGLQFVDAAGPEEQWGPIRTTITTFNIQMHDLGESHQMVGAWIDAPMFAAPLDAGGSWSLIGPVVAELSGRFGVRRLIRLPIPAADAPLRRPAGFARCPPGASERGAASAPAV